MLPKIFWKKGQSRFCLVDNNEQHINICNNVCIVNLKKNHLINKKSYKATLILTFCVF